MRRDTIVHIPGRTVKEEDNSRNVDKETLVAFYKHLMWYAGWCGRLESRALKIKEQIASTCTPYLLFIVCDDAPYLLFIVCEGCKSTEKNYLIAL